MPKCEKTWLKKARTEFRNSNIITQWFRDFFFGEVIVVLAVRVLHFVNKFGICEIDLAIFGLEVCKSVDFFGRSLNMDLFLSCFFYQIRLVLPQGKSWPFLRIFFDQNGPRFGEIVSVKSLLV